MKMLHGNEEGSTLPTTHFCSWCY